MSGEEFNADYRPLPQLSPGLFGGEPYGKGRWLYGSWIDWEQLKLPEKTQMLEDMKSIIKIRRSHSELIKPCRMGDTKRNFAAIEYEPTESFPSLIAIWKRAESFSSPQILPQRRMWECASGCMRFLRLPQTILTAPPAGRFRFVRCTARREGKDTCNGG